jgi:hypothetical protein
MAYIERLHLKMLTNEKTKNSSLHPPTHIQQGEKEAGMHSL